MTVKIMEESDLLRRSIDHDNHVVLHRTISYPPGSVAAPFLKAAATFAYQRHLVNFTLNGLLPRPQ